MFVLNSVRKRFLRITPLPNTNTQYLRYYVVYRAGNFGQFHNRTVCIVHERRLSRRRPSHHRIGQAGRFGRVVRHVLGAGPLLQRDEFHHAAGPVVHAVQSGQHGLQLRLPTRLQNAEPEPRGRPVRRAKNVCK